MPTTAFDPAKNGFAFVNYFTFDEVEVTRIRAQLTGSVGNALSTLSPAASALAGLQGANKALGDLIQANLPHAYGLCGGMAYAALDYFKAGRPLPRGRGPQDWPTRSTPGGAALRDYLWKRLLDSLGAGGGAATTLAWQVMLHRVPSFWPFSGGPGWLLARSRQQWAVLKGHLDQGEPWPIILVGDTHNPFNNHQVLAYGYEDNGDNTGVIHVYDMNSPGNQPPGVPETVGQTLRIDLRGPALAAVESCPSAERGPLRGFNCSAYTFNQPPDVAFP